MKIIIDITHIPHINFLKNAVRILKDNGNDVKIICLDRGKNIAIAKEEFKGVEIIPIGKHRGTIRSIILEANLLRFFLIFNYLIRNKFDMGLSVGGFLLGFGLKFFNKPNIQYYDDPENKKNLFFQKLTASKLFYPMFFKNKGISNFNALKEWAYLSPHYFKPNKKCLNEYNLSEEKYIFVREVNVNTTNYMGQQADFVLSIADKISSDIKVILSLENKDKSNLYPKSWQILKEPISDIHSLMYYSKVVLSSGDSMAREGGMLGVPSIYCGIREMAANKVLHGENILFHEEIEKVPELIERIYNQKETINKEKFRSHLLSKWDDVTQLIVSSISKNQDASKN